MSETVYLKCQCQNCGNSIEFPEQGAGHTIPCPHCHQSTRLSDPRHQPALIRPEDSSHPPARPAVASPSVEYPPSRARRKLIVGIAVLLILTATGIFAFRVWIKPGNSARATLPKATGTGLNGENAIAVETRNSAPSDNHSLPSAQERPAAEKSPADFKTGSIVLSPAKGSSLIYATGSLTNSSPHQRFGVRIEIALTDATGRDVGIARDYRPVIEPGGVWNFRALVLDSKAAAATVKQITEEP